jgi:hypothetical protein
MASGIPTTALGRVRFTHARKLEIPIPGSMMTGTAPSLKSAKAAAISGRPGFTMTSVRSPRSTPAAFIFAHQPLVSARSSANVSER